MSFVPVKGEESQDIQNLHRVRERLVAERTALVNQLRGILAEYGIVMPKGFTKMRLLYPIIEEQRERLSELMLSTVNELGEELRLLNQRMKIVETKIELIHKRNPVCQRLSEVPGVGALTSTAIVAAVSDATTFKNGRQFGAWIGLVPRQQSTGGKAKLLGITKKGNPYLRKLLILGARTVISRAKNKLDDRSLWIKETKERIGMNKTAVALANKNARTLWVLLANPDARFKNSFCKEAERLKLAA
jgi:transposase